MLVLGWYGTATTQTAWAWANLPISIIGGALVAHHDPIAASTVLVVTLGDRGPSICTGSIVDTDLMITAGHCVGPAPGRMLVLFSDSISNGKMKTTRVTAYIRHYAYAQGQNDQDMNDIALVRFEGGLPAGYHPVKLLEDASILRDGTPVILAGYGREIGDVSQHKGDDGSGTLRKVATTIRTARHGETEFLTEQSQGRGACHGDSGGPAFVQLEDGSLRLFGVTSRGPSNVKDDCGTVGIYTHILAHLEFLEIATILMRDYGWSD